MKCCIGILVVVLVSVVLGYMLMQNMPQTSIMVKEVRGEVRRANGSERISADGKLAFLSDVIDPVTSATSRMLFIVDNGGVVHVNNIISPLSWAPDGSWGMTSGSDGRLVKINYGHVVEIVPLDVLGLCPEVGPRGKVAFLDQGRVKILIPGGEVRRVDSPPGQCEKLEWLPDGSLHFEYWMPGEKPKEFVASFG